MQSFIKFVKVTVLIGLFITSLSTQVIAKASLIAEMADLDQVIIPAAVMSNQGKAEETKVAVSRLQSQWALFHSSVKDAFPGDKGWTMGLDKVSKSIVEVTTASAKGELAKVHEVLEGVRNTLEELREKQHIDYYLDGFSRYRRTLEKTTAGLTGKKASDLTVADIEFVRSRVPVLKAQWTSVQTAHLDADLFHFDQAKVAEIQSSIESVRKNIEKLESVASSGTNDQIYEALNRLKPSLKKTFLMFGDFQA